MLVQPVRDVDGSIIFGGPAQDGGGHDALHGRMQQGFVPPSADTFVWPYRQASVDDLVIKEWGSEGHAGTGRQLVERTDHADALEEGIQLGVFAAGGTKGLGVLRHLHKPPANRVHTVRTDPRRQIRWYAPAQHRCMDVRLPDARMGVRSPPAAVITPIRYLSQELAAWPCGE